MNLETPNRITVALDVFAALAVAGLARDPEFGYLRIPFIARDKTRLTLRDMAVHARAVPCAGRIIFLHVRWHQERLGDWRPHLFGDDVGEWKLLQGAPLARLQPRELQIMRTGHEYDLLCFTKNAAFRPSADKELIAAPLSFVFTSVECEFELAHIIGQTARRS